MILLSQTVLGSQSITAKFAGTLTYVSAGHGDLLVLSHGHWQQQSSVLQRPGEVSQCPLPPPLAILLEVHPSGPVFPTNTN